MEATIAQIQPDLATQNAGELGSSLRSRALGPIEMVAAIAGAFGLVGLILAATGLYGVMAFTVAQQRREIGLRIALGARAGQILNRVLYRGLTLAAVGVVLGVAVSLAVTRMMGTFLIGISAGDPATFVAVALVLIGVATVASLIPALRAAQIDPVRALRAD